MFDRSIYVVSIGLTFPFQQTAGSPGIILATEDEFQATVENVRSLLITNWGERLMHFNFGCNFVELLFQQLDRATLTQRITDRIIDQCQLWIPYVKLLDVKVVFPEEDRSLQENSFSVRLKFSIIQKPDIVIPLDQVIQGAG